MKQRTRSGLSKTVRRFLSRWQRRGDRRVVNVLRQVIEALSLEHDFERFFQRAAQAAADLLGADGAALMLINGAGRLEYRFFLGLPEVVRDQLQGYQFPRDQGVSGHALLSRRSLFVRDYAAHPGAMPVFVQAGLRADLVVPVMSRGEAIGILAVAWFERRVVSPSADRIGLVEAIAAQIGIASYRAQQERQLIYRANHDLLTGLPNRASFMDRLESEVQRARRESGHFCVLLLDLDGFKEVNDRGGHNCGDAVLRDVAQRLRAVARTNEFVARLGGDEFALVAQYGAYPEEVSALAQRLLDATLFAPTSSSRGGYLPQVAASVGVACYPGDAQDGEALLHCADLAMYEAKRERGGRQYCFFDPELEQRTRYQERLLAELESALAAGELRLHYQPVVSLADGSLSGTEALLRWQPEVGPLRPAGSFIEVVERHSPRFACDLGRWVLREALVQQVAWRRAGIQVSVAVNISAHHFLEKDFAHNLEILLGEFPAVPAANLTLEITESSLLADLERARAVMLACKELGVQVALDDFGTGYASLAYLKGLPVDVVKIDRAFVTDVASNRGDRAIVEAIVSMARVLDIRVIAEGVETAQQADFLRRLDCAYAQGYGYGRPMPAVDFVAAWFVPEGQRCFTGS